jgi:hypothetical protein
MKHRISPTRHETHAKPADRPGDTGPNKQFPDALAFADRTPHIDPMVQIRREGLAKDCTCPHCGTTYEVTWGSPARDTGSVNCEVCDQIMMKWDNSPIPLFRIKRHAEASRRPRGLSFPARALPPKEAS